MIQLKQVWASGAIDLITKLPQDKATGCRTLTTHARTSGYVQRMKHSCCWRTLTTEKLIHTLNQSWLASTRWTGTKLPTSNPLPPLQTSCADFANCRHAAATFWVSSQIFRGHDCHRLHAEGKQTTVNLSSIPQGELTLSLADARAVWHAYQQEGAATIYLS